MNPFSWTPSPEEVASLDCYDISQPVPPFVFGEYFQMTSPTDTFPTIADYSEEETEALIMEYELVRLSGGCNMLEISCVRRIADSLNFHLLAAITQGEYLSLLGDYGDLAEAYQLNIPSASLHQRLNTLAVR